MSHDNGGVSGLIWKKYVFMVLVALFILAGLATRALVLEYLDLKRPPEVTGKRRVIDPASRNPDGLKTAALFVLITHAAAMPLIALLAKGVMRMSRGFWFFLAAAGYAVGVAGAGLL